MPSKWTDPNLYADHASKSKCGRCGAPVIKGRAGLVMALDVQLDPEPVLDESWVFGTDRMLWCLKGKRILWRDHKHCGHIVLADHDCRGEDMSEADPFGIDGAPTKQRSPYAGMLHPVTGKVIGRHSRATNFIKGISDDFALQQWMKRMIVKGMTPEALEEMKTLHVSRDAKRIDEICANAKKAAGGDDAANLGTRLHKQTEYWDTEQPEKVSDEWMPRIREYGNALLAHEITIIPELVERKVWHTGFVSQITGSFDRIVRLSDGTYAILDVKTGSLDPDQYMEKWLSIAAQLVIYQEAVNEHGVWEPQTRSWTRVPQVRTDFALVAHLPAQGSGCTVYELELEPGRRALDALRALKAVRKTTGFVKPYVAPVGVTVDIPKLKVKLSEALSVAEPKDLPFLIDTAKTKSALLGIMETAKALSCWNADLSERCKGRLKVIESRA